MIGFMESLHQYSDSEVRIILGITRHLVLRSPLISGLPEIRSALRLLFFCYFGSRCAPTIRSERFGEIVAYPVLGGLTSSLRTNLSSRKRQAFIRRKPLNAPVHGR
jgi:hypothetical protein